MDKMILSLLCITFLLFQNVNGVGRILNGYPIDIEHAPYMAYINIDIGNGLETYCGGSIVHEHYILLAGHCE